MLKEEIYLKEAKTNANCCQSKFEKFVYVVNKNNIILDFNFRDTLKNIGYFQTFESFTNKTFLILNTIILKKSHQIITALRYNLYQYVMFYKSWATTIFSIFFL